MTPIQLVDFLINAICDPRYQIAAALTAGLFAMLIGWHWSWRAGFLAGGIGACVTFGILAGVAYLLNLPLGEPLPALPTDYTQFWIVIGAAYACWEFLKAVTVFLFLASILSEIRGWKEPEQ